MDFYLKRKRACANIFPTSANSDAEVGFSFLKIETNACNRTISSFIVFSLRKF